MSDRIFANQSLFIRRIAILLVIALVLMLLDSQGTHWFAPIRSASHALMQPIYQFSKVPSFIKHWGKDLFTSKEFLLRDNMRLNAELIQARARLQRQDYLLMQNARLKGILSTTESSVYNLALAQVIGTDTNPLKQILVLNKGSNDGVRIGQTVIDEKGLLGQIINVYANTSRVMLITDDEQAVAVVVARTGQRAIVSGDGLPKQLSLDYIFKTSDVKVGDELITSGLGERFPAGYLVGRITHIDVTQVGNFANIKVEPASDTINTPYVLILQNKSSASHL